MDRIKRLSFEVLEKHKSQFGENFDENKKMLNKISIIRSKGLKNEIAGFITKFIKKEIRDQETKQAQIDAAKIDDTTENTPPDAAKIDDTTENTPPDAAKIDDTTENPQPDAETTSTSESDVDSEPAIESTEIPETTKPEEST